MTAVVFFLCLLPFELLPEIPVDIDSKPFFVPLALCALLPARRIGLAIGLGVALGEGLRDLMEGYELDDPIGFFGYIFGFWLASYVFAIAPRNKIILFIGSVACAFVQGSIEATSFLLFGEEGVIITIESAIGNTITHGIIWGAIPLYFLLPALRGKFEGALGFAPRGQRPGPPLEKKESDWQPPESSIAWIKDFQYRFPGEETLALNSVSFAVKHGQTLLIRGTERTGLSTLVQALSGMAPDAIGGEALGERSRPKSYFILSHAPRDQMTQARPVQQVASTFMAQGDRASDALQKADQLLSEAGFSAEKRQAYIWTLDRYDQLKVLVCAAKAAQSELLVIDQVGSILGDETSTIIQELVDSRPEGSATLILESLDTQIGSPIDQECFLRDGELVQDKPLATEPAVAPDTLKTDDTGETLGLEGVQIPTLQQFEDGWWQRRDPRTKWALFLGLIILIYISPDWRWMAAACGLGLIIALTARPNLLWLAFALFVQLPNVIGLVLLPAFAGDGLQSDDFAFGLRLGFGWVAAILFGISLLSTMDIPDMVAGLRGIGLPRKFAFQIGYTFLLIYQSLADFAMLLRRLGINLKNLSFFRPVEMTRKLGGLFVPLITTVAQRGGIMAMASSDSSGTSSPYPEKKLSIIDWLMLACLAAAIVSSQLV